MNNNERDLGDGQTVTLHDGRRVGYLVHGPKDGIPLFFFHGTPGSRFSFAIDDEIMQMKDVLMILPERPGYGLSSPKPGRTLVDWPDDVAELANHLGFRHFAVAGASGGGPHALVCAWKLPERVKAAFVFASPTPIESVKATRGMAVGNRLNFLLGSRFPWLMRLVMRNYAKTVMKKPDRFINAIAKQLCESDRKIIEDPLLREVFIKDLREAYRQGSEAQFIDGQIIMTARPWGFEFKDVRVPVYAWHGELDTLVPVSMAGRFAEIPGVKLRIVPDAGHLITEDKGVIEELEKALRDGYSRMPIGV